MMLLMMMTAAALTLLMVMVMMLLMMMTATALTLLMVVVMVLLMMMTAAALTLFMVVMVMMLLHQIPSRSILSLHSIHDLVAGQFVPGRGDQGSGGIMLPQQGHSSIQLCLCNGICAGQNNGGGRFDLIVVELTKVLHVNLYLAGIHHRNGIAQHHILARDLFHRSDHIRQLAHAGGLDDDPIRMVTLNHLSKGLAEITHQTAANAAGIHLGDVNTGILQETSVNTDLAKLILDEHQLLTAVSLLNHLLDQGRFAGTQKTGINIDDSHCKHLLFQISGILYHYFSFITRDFSKQLLSIIATCDILIMVKQKML